MSVSPRRLVRLLTGAALLVGSLTGTALTAAPARAICANPDGCITYYNWDSTLTVTAPAQGKVTSQNGAIDCPGTACSVTDSKTTTTDTRPTGSWPTYTLTGSGGPQGYSPSWSSCDSVTDGQCVVTNDSETGKTVALSWQDTTPPTVTLTAPSKVGPSTPITATANDSAGLVDVYVWSVDDGASFRTTNRSLVLGSDRSEGTHKVTVRAQDRAGNQSSEATATMTLDKTVQLTLDPTPEFVNGPYTVTFSTDPDVVSFSCQTTGEPWVGCTTPTSYDLPMDAQTADRTYDVRIGVADDVGNAVSTSRTITLDRTEPAVAVTSGPAEGATIGTSSTTFGYTVDDAHPGTVTCGLDAEAAAPCGTEVDVAGLVPGPHAWTVTATDLAGNVGTVTRHFSYRAPTNVRAHPKRARVRHGRPVTLVADHLPAAAGGRVVFKKRSTTLCAASVKSGVATCQTSKRLRKGLYSVVASYLGNANYAPSKARTSFRIL